MKNSSKDILNGYVLNEGEEEVRSQNCSTAGKKAAQATGWQLSLNNYIVQRKKLETRHMYFENLIRHKNT